ncbi:small multi-drug export protein [Brevibacillus laterosporus]|uniref:Small multi-drug export protein n=1 Tax=Brevibacillus halotolerans TaxID=1507437 RepID=A0ABT4HXW5_9BACL|nr:MULTISPECIES: small multi-drug export protein [Brevibacillus]MCR8985674.1 small multi-drug export protein [Brevibacillus laterosporus]MCZ0831408.1 small multi-drug export protein [Brevibacillus halotolerans]GIO03173.1 hypothetical protein J5TS2_38410 [Brevibacillus halotolerans]
MNLLWPYLIIFLFAATPMFEVIAMIPIGIFAGLNPILVSLVALVGNAITVFLLILLMEKVQIWLQNKRGDKEPSKRQQRARQLFKKYGLPGLSILGPALVGSHLTAIMGMSFGATRQKMLLWIGISLVAWTGLAMVIGYFGADLMNIGEQNGFLMRMLQK